MRIQPLKRMKSALAPLMSAALLLLSAHSLGDARIPYQNCFDAASRLHNVPVELLQAVAATESGWNPDARSDKNAHGIMQIQWPGTAKHLGVRRVAELYNPCLNIELGTRYLRELLDANGGDVQRALAAYNYGPTRIQNSVELPDGAKRYAQKVTDQQMRIERSVSSAITAPIAGSRVIFDSRGRAEGFARLLNERIQGASFTINPDGEGGHAVAMEVAEAGLTTSDIVTLSSLGWSEMGAGR